MFLCKFRNNIRSIRRLAKDTRYYSRKKEKKLNVLRKSFKQRRILINFRACLYSTFLVPISFANTYTGLHYL